MSSSNNDNAQYPVLSDISNTSAETLNNNAVTNLKAQKSVNNAFVTHFNNNANDTFNNTSATTWQIRFSAQAVKIALESLDSHEDLSSSELCEQQEYEINQINDDGLNDTFAQFHLISKAEMTEVYKKLSALIHSDKQSKD